LLALTFGRGRNDNLRPLFSFGRADPASIDRTRFLPRGPSLLRHLLFVVAVLVVKIPSGEDYYARRQSLLLAPLFGILDVEKDVIRVFGLLLVLALKAVSPRS
jgi:hypothetical protein